MNRTLSTVLGFTVLAATTILATGCAELPGKGSIVKKMPWSKKKDKPEPYPNPSRMAATWTPDTLVQTGRTPTRGFGGRLFFYDEKTRAVPVEGELTVHAFEETVDGNQGEVKRYHFTPEQFTQHFSQTDIGASYSVWIPWDAVGGDHTKISLVPSFRAANGRLVQGEQALVGLPGKRPNAENVASRPTAASILEASRDNSKSGLVTTTIPVRGGMPRDMSPSRAMPSRNALPPQADTLVAAMPAATPTPLLTAETATPDALDAPLEAIDSGRKTRLFATAPFASKPPVPRPQRLGQRDLDPTKGVVRASATLPIE